MRLPTGVGPAQQTIKNFDMRFPKLYSAFFCDRQCLELFPERHLTDLEYRLSFGFPKRALMTF